MKIANETKVGLMAVIALAGLILGFNFLKGSSLFQHSKKLYALFNNVDGMEVSNAVQIDGLTIGNISAITETDADLSRGILVTITLKKEVHIPRNSIATLNPGLLISPTVVIAKGDATEYLQNGDTLQTKQKPNIIAQVQQNIDPIIAKLNGTLTSLDSLIEVIGGMFDPRTKNNFSALLANLADSTAELQKLLNNQTGYLAQSLKNLNDFTGNLDKEQRPHHPYPGQPGQDYQQPGLREDSRNRPEPQQYAERPADRHQSHQQHQRLPGPAHQRQTTLPEYGSHHPQPEYPAG